MSGPAALQGAVTWKVCEQLESCEWWGLQNLAYTVLFIGLYLPDLITYIMKLKLDLSIRILLYSNRVFHISVHHESWNMKTASVFMVSQSYNGPMRKKKEKERQKN